MKNLIPGILILTLPLFAFGQLELKNQQAKVIDFDKNLPNVNKIDYRGTGFASSPVNGQLDADAWSVTGLSAGDMDFGEDRNDGPFARGKSGGGVTTGGLYAMAVGTIQGNKDDIAFGFQPTGSDLTPGSIILRILNGVGGGQNSSTTITGLVISYDVYVYNDQSRSTSLNFSHSPDNVNYTTEASQEVVTPAGADAQPSWVKVSRSVAIPDLNIPQGNYFYIRWEIADAGGSGSRDELAIDNISVQLTGTILPTPRLFRTVGDGDWSDPTIWEASGDGVNYGPVSFSPDFNNSDEILVRNGNKVFFNINKPVDQVTVESGGKLIIPKDERLKVNNSSGTDLLILGTLQDDGSSGNGLSFNPGAEWELGPAGEVIKTNNSSAAVYRDFYKDGDISTIPATASWILRYTGEGEPTLVTVDMYFPNLIFESTDGDFTPTLGFARFQGASGTAVIKGNLDVGGAGTGTYNMINENTGGLIAVKGNCIIRSGSSLNLNDIGAVNRPGFSFEGNITVDGALDFTQGEAAIAGSVLQIISGAGTTDFDDLTIGNPIQMESPVSVQGLVSFITGKIILTDADLTLSSTASFTGQGSTSFVRTSGTGALVRPVGASAVFFPIGKAGYNPLSLSNGGDENYGARVENVVRQDGNSGPALTENVVQRSWYISQPGAVLESSGVIDVTVNWNDTDQGAGFDPNLCYISQFLDPWEGDIESPAGPGNGTTYSRSRAGVNVPALLGVGSNLALPVELGDFQAHLEENSVVLEWYTLSEQDNDYFSVEKSSDGITFTGIGRVEGAGSTFSRQDYRFVDDGPLPGLNYYRLRQVDYDGTFEFSPVRSVILGEATESKLLLYPVPATNVLTLNWSAPLPEPATVFLSNSLGQRIARQQIPAGASQMDWPVDQLPAGTYWIQVILEGKRMTKSFVKK